MPNPIPTVENVAAAFSDTLRNVHQLRVGGQATVYRATRLRNSLGIETGDDVALKVYFDPTQDQRVDREIDAAKTVRSGNLCELFNHGYITIGDYDYQFLTWSYIEGEPLDTVLQKGPVPPNIAAVIGRDVAKAVQAIWDKRIVHRDVNPKNIMLVRGLEKAILIDLGVAKYLDHSPLTAAGLTWVTQNPKTKPS
jgi:serine/threonine protein kinase